MQNAEQMEWSQHVTEGGGKENDAHIIIYMHIYHWKNIHIHPQESILKSM